jgi:serine/threonine protein kinase
MSEEPLNPTDPVGVGSYRFVSRLGSGATGVVYRALGPNGIDVAVKLLRPELADNQNVRERLRREADALRMVSGGRTAKVLEVDADSSTPFLVTELVPGDSLDLFVANTGPLRGGILWSVVEGLVEALESIHNAGIIHRDLKPTNIMIGADGAKVVDFGISAIQDVVGLTSTGAFIGTAAWISPEQVNGGMVTTKSDIFSLGLVLAFASTGTHPFGSGRSDAVMFRIAHESPTLTGIPESLRPIVESCLNKNPLLRPSLELIRSSLIGIVPYKIEAKQEDYKDISSTRMVGQTQIETGLGRGPTLEPPAVHSPVLGSDNKKKPNLATIAGILVVVALGAALVLVNNRSTDSDSVIAVSPVATNSTESTANEGYFNENFDWSTFSGDLIEDLDSSGSPSFGEAGDSADWARITYWGTQLDCRDYQPLKILSYANEAKPIFQNTYANRFAGDDHPNTWIDGTVAITVFTGFNESKSSFSDRVSAVHQDIGDGCSDEDFYLDKDAPQINSCIRRMFPDGNFSLSYVDSYCAKQSLLAISWDTDSTKNISFVNDDDPGHGRPGYSVILAAGPESTDDLKWAARIYVQVLVWEAEDIGVVLVTTSSNSDPEKYSSGGDKLWEFAGNLSVVAEESIVNTVNKALLK